MPRKLTLGCLLTLLTLCGPGMSPAHAAERAEIRMSISAIHHMSPAQASKKLAVVTEAVTTDVAGWPYGISVQDGDDGMYLGLVTGVPKVAVGQRVLIHGTTDPGRFATIIVAGRLDVLGPGDMPRPYFASAREIASGELDNRRVEVRGVVRATTKGIIGPDTGTFMVVDMNPGTVHVAVAPGLKIDVTKFVDATVRASGVVGVEFNSRRQALGGGVIVNRTEDISLVRAPSADALSGPPTSIASIFAWGAKKDWSHRIKVSGVLTLQRPGEYLILQDGDQSIRVDSLDADPLPVGARCDAAGFAVPAPFGPMLADAVVACHGNAAPLKPVLREASKISLGDDNWLLVRLRARLIEVHESGSGVSFSLEDHGVRFTADAPGSAARDLEKIAPGSQVELTGINEVLVDILRRAKGFHLLVRSPKDVVVLGRGPWLNAGQMLWGALALAVLASLCAAWALALRSRVRKQTAWISESLLREKANAWLHAERGRILGLISRNAPLPRICEALTAAITGGWPDAKVAIGIHSDGQWQWTGDLSADSDPAAQTFEVDSSSGGLRAKVTLTAAAADADGELIAMCRECMSVALEHADLHQRLLRQSLSDSLTKLPNRRSLDAHLNQVLSTAGEKRCRPAVLLMDMNGFKAINDTLGHAAGDIVLQTLAERFRTVMRGVGMIGRVGGDEFIAVLEHVSGLAEAQAVANRLAEGTAGPIDISGIEINPSLSIGIALCPVDGTTAQELKCAADTRMYEYKMTRKSDPVLQTLAQ